VHVLTTTQKLVADAIKSRVEAFSDRRLNDGDDVWRERELEMRCEVAKTANAIAEALADDGFDSLAFAAACGLYVSNGRDNYGDCYAGELTWEQPVPSTTPSDLIPDAYGRCPRCSATMRQVEDAARRVPCPVHGTTAWDRELQRLSKES
jgi:hypothetical protein